MILPVCLGEDSYDIVIERGCLMRAGELLSLRRRVLIVTDDGVPREYAQAVAAQCAQPVILSVEQGEDSKSLETYGMLLQAMLREGFTRGDCVIAVGGGVVGDLSGFAAASYMRGVDFYNIPTTVLSQVDSSIGGKTAINLNGIKNIVGAFYQPKKVLIDTTVLQTLPKRQIANGMAEAVKMSLTSNAALFDIFENGSIEENIDAIIEQSLRIKKSVVEEDEKEQGFRKILNFGHTIGHGIESFEHLNGLYHGECVALGMLPMCSTPVRERLAAVLRRLDLPTSCELDEEQVYQAMLHDKKAGAGGSITVTLVNEVGSFEMRAMPVSELRSKLPILSKGAEIG